VSPPLCECMELIRRRARVDTTREDRARGKRMFGNILGTLQRFKKDDKNLRTSDAVRPFCVLKVRADE
jgi:hypothetical protein